MDFYSIMIAIKNRTGNGYEFIAQPGKDGLGLPRNKILKTNFSTKFHTIRPTSAEGLIIKCKTITVLGHDNDNRHT